MDFAQKLLQLMAHRRITQEALGDALGVSHVAVGKWLRGAKPRPTMGVRVAEFFGVPPDTLLDDSRGLPDEVTSVGVKEIAATYAAESSSAAIVLWRRELEQIRERHHELLGRIDRLLAAMSSGAHGLSAAAMARHFKDLPRTPVDRPAERRKTKSS